MQIQHSILLLVILFFLSVKFLPCQIICLFNPFILAWNAFRKLAQNISWIQCRWLGILHCIGRSHDTIIVALIRVFWSFGISFSNEEIVQPHLVPWYNPEPINEKFNMINGPFKTQFSEEYQQSLIGQTCYLLIEKRTSCGINILGCPVSVCWWGI